MSKLDYVTIAIVTICFAAIIFLIVKITQLMNRDQPELEPNRIEETLGEQEAPAAAYDTIPGKTGSTGDEKPTAAPEAGTETQAAAEEEYYDPAAEESPDDRPTREEELTPRGGQQATQREETYRAPATTGAYMVLAGSFRFKHNAEARVRELRQLGYEDARVGYFNQGTYAVAIVGRYADISQARSIVDELENKHKIEARVKEN